MVLLCWLAVPHDWLWIFYSLDIVKFLLFLSAHFKYLFDFSLLLIYVFHWKFIQLFLLSIANKDIFIKWNFLKWFNLMLWLKLSWRGLCNDSLDKLAKTNILNIIGLSFFIYKTKEHFPSFCSIRASLRMTSVNIKEKVLF